MKIERITPILIPGHDCIYAQHCPYTGDPNKNHGIHGDEYLFGVRAELADGRFVAASLQVFTSRFPSTVPASHFADAPQLLGVARGASIDFHVQLAIGELPSEKAITSSHGQDCEALGKGRRCHVLDSSALWAKRIYEAYGIQSDAPGIDLTIQPDALYQELIGYMVRRIGVIT